MATRSSRSSSREHEESSASAPAPKAATPYEPKITGSELATVTEITGYGSAAPGDTIVRADDGDSIALPAKWAKLLGVEPTPPKEA